MINYSTEYLIIHEDEIDWDKLSANPEDSFSLIEIRLFRKRINWKLYFRNHSKTCPFTTQMLEIASKYFDKETYCTLAAFNMVEQDFIENHLDDFDFYDIIRYCKVNQEFLMNTTERWINLKNLSELFEKSEFIDLEDPSFAEVKLLMDMIK